MRAGGHSVAGTSTVEGGIVIDVRPMDTITIDADGEDARASARGDTGGSSTAPRRSTVSPRRADASRPRASRASPSAAAPAGSNASTASRATTSISVDLVLANGEQVTASKDRASRSLLGAARRRRQLRRRDLVRVPAASGRPARARGPDVVARGRPGRRRDARYRDLADGAPEELGGGFVSLTGPPEEFVPTASAGATRVRRRRVLVR